MRQVGQPLRRILGDLHGVEGPVGGASDQEHVDQPNEPCVAQPGQLGQHLAGERRLLVADDQHLDRAHHPVTRLARRCVLGGADQTVVAKLLQCLQLGRLLLGRGRRRWLAPGAVVAQEDAPAACRGCDAAYAWAGVNRPP